VASIAELDDLKMRQGYDSFAWDLLLEVFKSD